MTEVLEETASFTIEDWLAIPETRRKIEFISGGMWHMPTPTVRHQRICVKLTLLLEGSNPDPDVLWVVPDVDVLLGQNGFEPDLVVAPPGEVRPITGSSLALAVEVESPSSLGNDRLMKPPVLAQHGVPSYWRIEPEPLVVHVYELAGEHYVETQTATGDEMVEVARPWPLSFRVSELEP